MDINYGYDVYINIDIHDYSYFFTGHFIYYIYSSFQITGEPVIDINNNINIL